MEELGDYFMTKATLKSYLEETKETLENWEKYTPGDCGMLGGKWPREVREKIQNESKYHLEEARFLSKDGVQVREKALSVALERKYRKSTDPDIQELTGVLNRLLRYTLALEGYLGEQVADMFDDEDDDEQSERRDASRGYHDDE